MAERIAVIGSNSFSGASFVRHCLEQGLNVLGVSRSEEPRDCFLPYRWSTPASGPFDFVRGDLNHDLDKIMTALEQFAPSSVVNFAAQGMVAQSWDRPMDWYQTNVVANVAFHDRLRRLHSLRRYVHVGTPEVYGSTEGWVTEDRAPMNPSTPYAASRAACDLHLRTFFTRYQFPVCWTRAANVYGPGQQLYRIIPRTILFIRLGRKLQLHGGGHSVRSFIHIDDVAAATLAVARAGVPGDCYHLSTRDVISIRDLVALICRLTGARFEDVVDVVDDRPGKDAAYLLDSTKARRELGWSDSMGLEAGIRHTIQWVDTHLEELRQQPFDYQHKP